MRAWPHRTQHVRPWPQVSCALGHTERDLLNPGLRFVYAWPHETQFAAPWFNVSYAPGHANATANSPKCAPVHILELSGFQNACLGDLIPILGSGGDLRLGYFPLPWDLGDCPFRGKGLESWRGSARGWVWHPSHAWLGCFVRRWAPPGHSRTSAWRRLEVPCVPGHTERSMFDPCLRFHVRLATRNAIC